MLFFSKNKLLALLIMLVSFFTPFTGVCGLAALAIALIAAYSMGFQRQQVQNGLLTYSVVLFGLGFGTNFESGPAFYMLLIVGALLTLFLSIALNAILNKRGLPALSLAFIISTSIIIVASKSFEGIGLTHRHIYWFNDVYALGGNRLVNVIQSIENMNMPVFVNGYFRSLSAILFQINIASGILLAAGLLVYSRIAFILTIVGYTTALLFSYAMGGFHPMDMTYYNMGTNFMLTAVALGGFYIIPSLRSFLWTLLTVPVTYLLVIALGSIVFKIGVPVFSLPFCITVMLFLFVLQLRSSAKKLVLTHVQYFSPEQNLYRYINGRERVLRNFYHQLTLPFLGEWMVSQGYDGHMTHKGDWSKAIDFVVLDEEMKTYRNPGNQPDQFYCYNKPVVSPADGIVQEIVDFVEDNAIGMNNTSQNWGNSIVIKHAEGIYTKLSHLRKNAFQVTKGSYVYRGQIIAYCGNSGRSPEPHLHFQVQHTPYIGSKTMAYPLAAFVQRIGNAHELKTYAVPVEGSFVSNVALNVQLQEAFNLQPGFMMQVAANGFATEQWEVLTSAYNESYLYCSTNNAYAYFVNTGTLFYFTNYFGPRNTLLFQFYKAAFKVLLSSEKAITITDNYPLNVMGTHPLQWLQDAVAPFFIFMKMSYEARVKQDDGVLSAGTVTIHSKQYRRRLFTTREKTSATISIESGQLKSFTIILPNKTIEAICTL